MPPAQRVVTLIVPSLLVIAAVMSVVVLVLTLGTGPPGGTPSGVGDREPDSSAPLGPPTTAVLERARPSALLITATGCPRESIGSGAMLDAGVVTNAHVVAGATEVLVVGDDGRQYVAEVRAFDPVLDLALLDVGNVSLPALTIGKPHGGTETVALVRDEFDVEAPLRPLALSIERTINIFIADIYGAGRHERRGIEVRGDVGPGDSGAGVIDGNGSIVGVLFSASRRSIDVGYAISATELDDFVAMKATYPIGAGSCIPR